MTTTPTERPESSAIRRAQRLGARVGVERQQHERPVLRRIRVVDAGRRADEAVAGLCDHERAALADDPGRLAQDHLHLARVALVARELDRLLGRRVVLDPNDLALGLRDRLLRDDDDVAILECGQLEDHGREIVALANLGQAVHRDDLDHGAGSCTPVTRIPACAL